MNVSGKYPSYNQFDPKVPVWCVTPDEGRTIHRFFDTSPFSPSGRYMALFRLPFEDRNPLPGEEGQVILLDLVERTERTVAKTCGWEPQVGAHVQWGKADSELFFNDVDTVGWKPYGVKLNPFTGERRKLDGCVFMISPDGKFAATTCPIRARRTQLGYGVVLPDEFVPRNEEIAEDDGLYITHTDTGKCFLLVSIKDIIEKARPEFDMDEYANGEFYGFQCKWNPQGSRLLFVLRWLSKDGKDRKLHVITMKNDGTDIHVAIPAREWAKGGHHINWCPDGEYISMNLNIDGNGMRFIKVKYDGTDLHKILNHVVGSGHPTVHPDGKHILTDSYTGESVAFGDGSIPIRLIQTETGEERVLVRMRTQTPYDETLRVDPHPAWDRSFKRIALNGYSDGTRRVYVADLSTLVG